MYVTRLACTVGGAQLVAQDCTEEPNEGTKICLVASIVCYLSAAEEVDEFEVVEEAHEAEELSFVVHDIASEFSERPCLCGCKEWSVPIVKREEEPAAALSVDSEALAESLHRYLDYMGTELSNDGLNRSVGF